MTDQRAEARKLIAELRSLGLTVEGIGTGVLISNLERSKAAPDVPDPLRARLDRLRRAMGEALLIDEDGWTDNAPEQELCELCGRPTRIRRLTARLTISRSSAASSTQNDLMVAVLIPKR